MLYCTAHMYSLNRCQLASGLERHNTVQFKMYDDALQGNWCMAIRSIHFG